MLWYPYFLFTICFFFLALKITTNEGVFLRNVIITISFLYFIAFRGYIGTDFHGYKLLFDGLPKIESLDSFSYMRKYYSDMEFGFCVWQAFIKTLNGTFLTWQVINSFLDIILLFIIIKRFNFPNIGLFFGLFFVFGGMAFEIEAMRNAKAIYIFLLATKYITEKKPIKYLLFIIFAMFFHVSSIIYVPFYFIGNRKPNKVVILLLFIFGYFILLSHISIFSLFVKIMSVISYGKFSILADRYLGSEVYYHSIFGTAERFITFLVLYKFQSRIYAKKGNYIAINAMYIYLLIFLYFSSVSIIAERVPLLFIFSYWIVYTEVYYNIKEKGLFLFLLSVYTGLKFYSYYGKRAEMAYENIFTGLKYLY